MNPILRRKLPVEILTPSEVLSLIGASSAVCPTGIRNRALLTILYRTGIRLAEALALRTKDVNLESGTVAVLHGKGDKMRVVGLEPGAAAVLSAWLAQRTALGLNGQQAIFCTLKGADIKQSYIRPLMKRLAGRAGIEKRVHAHGLRHTLAAELAAEGVPVNVIQKHLGHTSLATTATYLDHIAPAAVIQATAGRGWVLA
jgi:site-specific recombinase XerD